MARPRDVALVLTCWLAGMSLLIHGAPLAAQEPPGEEKQERKPARTLLERNRKLIRDLRSLGPWPEQAKLIRQANRNVFERYGWVSEEDRFAEKLAADVAQIPPWDFMGRFDAAFGAVAKRYQLDTEQTAQIKPRVIWRTMRLMGRHIPTLFDLSEEFLAARLERRPFTTEEVARWSQMSEPLMLDALEEFEGLYREVTPLLRPGQRELLDKDRAADLRRAKMMMERLGDWQQGKWEPQDWGLQDDPYHGGRPDRGTTAPALEAADLQPVADVPQYDPGDEDAWQRYVRDFIRRYRLDAEQGTAARAILGDVRMRAGVYRSAMLGEVGGSGSAEGMARINVRLFEELKRRLDQIPTEKQRRAVEGETPPPSSAGGVVESRPTPTTAPTSGG